MKKFFSSKCYAIAAIAVSLVIALFDSPLIGLCTLSFAGSLSFMVSAIDRMASGHYVFGAIDTTAVANTIQPHYSKKLLDHAVQELQLIDYAHLEELPAQAGNSTVRFFRPPQADLTATGAPASLSEGTAPTNFRDISYTAVDVTLGQIGQVSKVTDIATNVALVKYLDTAIALQGEEFALDVDTRLRNKLVHQSTGLTKRYAQGLANFAALSAASLSAGKIVPRDFLDAFTKLKLNRAPKVNGVYVAIVPPEGTRDIMNSSDWKEVVRYNNANKLFKGEVGEFFGNRIIEGTNPFKEDETEGTEATSFSAAGTNTTGFIYSTIITGKGAFGAVNLKKLGAAHLAHKPQVIIVDKPDSANPLGQYVIVGWKAYWGAMILNSAWGITLRHKTEFVA